MRNSQALRIGGVVALVLGLAMQGCTSSRVHRGQAMNVSDGEVGVAECVIKKSGSTGEIQYVLVNRGHEQRAVQLHVLDMAAMHATLATQESAVPVFEQIEFDDAGKPDLVSEIVVPPGGSVMYATRGPRDGVLAREAIEAIESGEALRLVVDVAGLRAVR